MSVEYASSSCFEFVRAFRFIDERFDPSFRVKHGNFSTESESRGQIFQANVR
jgi:hypothetical protein